MSDSFAVEMYGEECELKMLGDKILVERSDDRPVALEGGVSLVLPDTMRKKLRPSSGIVRAVGSRVKDLHIGDVIHWGLGCGVPVDGTTFHIVTRPEVFAREPFGLPVDSLGSM